MSNYYSNEAYILNGPCNIEITVDSNFIASPNYGADASSTPVFHIIQNTMTGTVTVSNSSSGLVPNIYWTYVKNGQTNTIDSPFSSVIGWESSEVPWPNVTYDATLTIDTNADLEEWGNVEIYLNVDPYEDGAFTINTLPSGGLGFTTDWGTPPSGIVFSPNLSNQTLQEGAAALTSVLYSYDSIGNVEFEYSDDNKSTWNEVGNEQGTRGALSGMTTLQGYGTIGTPPSITIRTEQLTVSYLQFVSNRFYRIKATAS